MHCGDGASVSEKSPRQHRGWKLQFSQEGLGVRFMASTCDVGIISVLGFGPGVSDQFKNFVDITWIPPKET